MNRTVAGPLAALALALTLSGCGGGTPPAKIQPQTVTFELRDTLICPVWGYGSGTLTLRRAKTGTTVGPKVAEGAFDAAGRGSLQLPGEDQGVLGLATQTLTFTVGPAGTLRLYVPSNGGPILVPATVGP